MPKLTDEISKYAARNPVRFHVPGHKGAFNPLDVTELFFTDNLYVPNETETENLRLILDLEERITKIFFPYNANAGGIKSSISCGGATLGIQAALLAAMRQKRRTAQTHHIICARNCHISFVNALALLDITPIWVYENFDFDTAFAQNTDKNIIAAFVTSPDYYGAMRNIRGISGICKQYGVPLIVDNAHGSHLAFHQNGELHAKNNGADIVVDSVHKTLPALTGAAIVHADSDYDIRDAMRAFASTSPSYLILQSIEKMLDFLEIKGRAEHQRLLDDIKRLVPIAPIPSNPSVSPVNALTDPFRIVLECENNGENLYHFLFDHEYNIACEFHEKDRVILIPSAFNKSSDFEALATALSDFESMFTTLKSCGITTYPDLTIPLTPATYNLSMSDAIKHPREIVAVSAANGRICAESIFAYPPGIPVILPGEVIDAERLAVIASLRGEVCVISNPCTIAR